jgi:5-methylcytosine-specific restriction enzyme A
MRPRIPCKEPWCPETVPPGTRYCDEHRAKNARDHDRRRGSSTARGYSYRWEKYSKRYRRLHPVCCDPHGFHEEIGAVVATEEVDHIEPVSGPDDPRFWDPSNHQPLCKSCHSYKTATENGRWTGKPDREVKEGRSEE